MKIGNVSFNPEAFKDYTKEQFFEEYKGKLEIDKEQVWDMIYRANKVEPKIVEHESTDRISEPGKKSKHKQTDVGTKSGS